MLRTGEFLRTVRLAVHDFTIGYFTFSGAIIVFTRLDRLPYQSLREKKNHFELLRKLCAQPAFCNRRANIKLDQTYIIAIFKMLVIRK